MSEVKQDKPDLRFSEFKDKWRNFKLKDIAELTSSKRIYLSDYTDNGIPFFRGAEITSLKKNQPIKEILYISKEKYLELKNKYGVPEKGDILITGVGTLGNVYKIPDDAPFYFKDGNLIWLRNISEDSDFLEFYLEHSKNEMLKLSIGSTQKALTIKGLEELEIKLPSSEEQRKLAIFLSSIDKKIELLENKLVSYKKFHKYVQLNIFSQKITFSNESWVEVKLSDICERVTRKNKNLESQIPLTISAQHGLVDQEEYFNKTVASKNLKGYYLLKKGEFAYNKSYSNGYPYGAIKRLENYEIGALSTLYICFKPKDNINSDFLKYYFESNVWHKEMYKIAVEGARNHGLLNIPVNDFFETNHIIPKSLEEQERIAYFLEKLYLKQINIENNLNSMKKFKQGLTQRMFV